MLRKVIPVGMPLMLVVGESKFEKVGLGNDILETYGYKNFKVLQGTLSQKDFPKQGLTAFSTLKESLNVKTELRKA